MRLALPPTSVETGLFIPSDFIEDTNLVVIGANGSGKTRFGVWIEKNHVTKTHRISAQKSLDLPNIVRPSSEETAKNEFLYGFNKDNPNNKMHNRWKNKPETILLDDYSKLVTYLHTEAYSKAMDYLITDCKPKPKTKLEKIRDIWEKILPHRKLDIKAGTIDVIPTDDLGKPYGASELSDGERVIFYFIGSVLSVPKNTIILIDEPEIHLHNSILKKLWDEIENIRSDCIFVYLTHSLEFASSRTNSKKIWVKSYSGNETWDYSIIDDTNGIPEEIYLEIMGSRKPILFVEGVSNSKLNDSHIYQHLFPEYTIKPVGSCEKVIDYTKSFNDNCNLHNLEAYGIVDKDRRSLNEINSLKGRNILVLDVAEIENLLIIEDLIKILVKRRGYDSEEVLQKVRENVFSHCKGQLSQQAFEYTKYLIEREVSIVAGKSYGKNISVYESDFKNKFSNYNMESIYQEHYDKLEQIITSKNYNEVLKMFNSKGMFPKSCVASLCGSTEKGYVDLINKLVTENTDEGNTIRKIMRKYVDPDDVLST